MKKNVLLMVFSTLVAIFLVACSDKENKGESKSASTSKIDGRWYSKAQLIRGKTVFKANCAVCHGDKGQGLTENWKAVQADGKFPPPPINGSAHAWHHTKALLLRTVNEGGIALGGAMPPFKDKLSAVEKEAVIAYVTSLWPEKTYKIWASRNPQ